LSRAHGIRHYVILLIILLLAVSGGFAYGFLSSKTRTGPYRTANRVFEWARHQPAVRRLYVLLAGRPEDPVDEIKGSWSPIADDQPAGETDARPGPDGEDFQSVGYLSGYEPAPVKKGVTVHVPDIAYEGLNLITSGHGQEAYLIDMKGKVLHRWAYRFADAFPAYADVQSEDPDDPFERYFWHRCYLYGNGDLLAIYQNFGLIKLDKNSNLIWAVANGCHHDIDVISDSLIYVITHKVRESPDLGNHGKVSDDFLTVLDRDGTELRRVSVLEAIRNSVYTASLRRAHQAVDILHTNTVQVFDGTFAHRSPVFRKGNILTSMRNMDVVAIVDMVKEKVVWALTGLWGSQHMPTLLANGNMLVFDNQGMGNLSRVIELDPFTQEIVWAYEGTQENGFYSGALGAAYRLPNGNTLIVESIGGRAFEVTPEKRIVWEYYNPHRAGDNDELIATLLDVVRLGPEFPTEWLVNEP